MFKIFLSERKTLQTCTPALSSWNCLTCLPWQSSYVQYESNYKAKAKKTKQNKNKNKSKQKSLEAGPKVKKNLYFLLEPWWQEMIANSKILATNLIL